MRRHIIFVVAMLPACSDPPTSHEEPSEIERCSVSIDPDAEMRAVEVGTRTSVGVAPYVDLQEVELVWGTQGGVMITPAVRVAAEPDDPERLCLRIDLDQSIAGGDPSDFNPGMQIQTWLEREGTYLVSHELDDLLAFDGEALYDETLELTASVAGNVQGETTVSLVLRASPSAP